MAESTRNQAGGKRDLQREARRGQILDAALAVFSQKGYHGANVSDVAAQAGVSQGTIYWYFDSKEALLLSLLEVIFGEILEPFVSVLEDVTMRPVERLRAAFRASELLPDANPERFRLLIHLWSLPGAAGSTDAVASVGATYAEQILTPLTDVVRQAMDAGDIPPSDARAIATVLAAMLDGLMLYALIWPEGLLRTDRLEPVVFERLLGAAPDLIEQAEDGHATRS